MTLRYGEQLLTLGGAGSAAVYHPWYPCLPAASTDAIHTDAALDRVHTQGQHNCANQTDVYVLRGSPGAVGPSSAAKRNGAAPPM